MRVLSFGLASAPRAFTQIVDFICWVCHQVGAEDVIHYLDDWFVPGNGSHGCSNKMDVVEKVCKDAGFAMNDFKREGPAKRLQFLGIIIDILRRILALSQERLLEVREELLAVRDSMSRSTVLTKRELLSLLGKLNFCTLVVKDGKFFTRRLIHLSKKPKALHHRVRVTPQAIADISWWLKSMWVHNGTSWFPTPFHIPSATLIFSDASDTGMGMFCGNSWVAMTFTGEYEWLATKPIALREMAACVICLTTFCERLEGQQVIVKVDNTVCMFCINNGKSKDVDLMGLVRVLYFIATRYKIHYQAIHLSSEANAGADSLSRADLEKFRLLYPNSDKDMTSPARIPFDM